ncbi:hypothetical protein BT96DRAFT_972401 [Gymnopus androsaceus JB14]|uniref:Uncharacterized protein n=1 Tax=Gymnopus androsaceus JB14 TaxID=1447944 RepID=A0A6A4I4U2_9AGAR|nr:hypothetical protein BT96DRAFT_972401 [Gymnopus androsaceus JB14]
MLLTPSTLFAMFSLGTSFLAVAAVPFPIAAEHERRAGPSAAASGKLIVPVQLRIQTFNKPEMYDMRWSLLVDKTHGVVANGGDTLDVATAPLVPTQFIYDPKDDTERPLKGQTASKALAYYEAKSEDPKAKAGTKSAPKPQVTIDSLDNLKATFENEAEIGQSVERSCYEDKDGTEPDYGRLGCYSLSGKNAAEKKYIPEIPAAFTQLVLKNHAKVHATVWSGKA